MDHAQSAIALVLRPDDDAKSIDVRKLRKSNRFALQLAPDGKGILFAPDDMRVDAGRLQFRLDLAARQ
jgi:hypothetical protein